MPQEFQPGDYLIFQLESGYGLLRILDIEGNANDPVWHLTAYRDLFLEIDMADAALENPDSLTVDLPHVALTNRAFESTQTAKMLSVPLTDAEAARIESENNSANIEVSDRSIRLMLGLR